MSCLEILYRPYSNQSSSIQKVFNSSTDENSSHPDSLFFPSASRNGKDINPIYSKTLSDEKSENTNFNWEISSFSKSANNSPKNAELFNKNYLNPLLQQRSKIGWSEINLQTSMKKLFSTSRSRETSSMYSSLNLNPTSESLSAFRKRDLPESNHEIPAKKQKNSQCVMLKYFDGSSSDEVDEHFNKALNRDSSSKKNSELPMSQRKFPASFWDSNYHQKKLSLQLPTYPLTLPFFTTYPQLQDYPNMNSLSRLDGSVGMPFSNPRFNFLSKLHLYQGSTNASSTIQNHINPVNSVYPQSSSDFLNPWKSFARISRSFSSQNFFSNRSMSAAALAAISSVPKSLNNSSMSKFNFLCSSLENGSKSNSASPIFPGHGNKILQ